MSLTYFFPLNRGSTSRCAFLDATTVACSSRSAMYAPTALPFAFATRRLKVGIVTETLNAIFSGPLGLGIAQRSSRYPVPKSSVSGTEYRNESIDLEQQFCHFFGLAAKRIS
jgi:hypothetical protein